MVFWLSIIINSLLIYRGKKQKTALQTLKKDLQGGFFSYCLAGSGVTVISQAIFLRSKWKSISPSFPNQIGKLRLLLTVEVILVN